jgi:cyclomaltodextrinase
VKQDREGGDDAVRPAFPDKPADLAPYGWPTYRVHQELIGLRRRHDWLQTARVRTVHLANEQFVYEAADSSHRLLVALNVGAASVELPAPYARGVVNGNAELARGGEAGAVARLAPHSFAILEV